MKSIVIVADSSFVVESIRMALRNAARLKVLGKVDGRQPCGRALHGCQPDIVLVDEMKSADHALDRIREAREVTPGATIVLLTARMEEDLVGKALTAGADACLSKSANLRSLPLLLREVVERNIVSAPPPAMADSSAAFAGTEDLTAREREILMLVADGLTNSRIGKQLWVTEQTVKFHLSNIYRKLGVSNRTEASRFAYMHGLTSRPALQLVPPPDAGALEPVDAAGAA
jgi:DNA-binding NarL/FixJ family response regulator